MASVLALWPGPLLTLHTYVANESKRPVSREVMRFPEKTSLPWAEGAGGLKSSHGPCAKHQYRRQALAHIFEPRT